MDNTTTQLGEFTVLADETDSRGNRTAPPQGTHTSFPLEVPGGAGATVESDCYNMTHARRGKIVIINNKTFSDQSMPDRHGTEVDADTLSLRFQELGFTVQLENNCTAAQMLAILEKAANEDHSDADCFACAILTHGEKGGIVNGTDHPIFISKLLEPFERKGINTLIEKPKLFFIQACRGKKLDDGHEVCDTGEDDAVDVTSYLIPTAADFLIAYSVVPGYFSFHNSAKGSWFVQALSRVLEEHGKTMELVEMLTTVNRKLAYDFQSKADKKKQIPCITSMLTKKVYFKPKN